MSERTSMDDRSEKTRVDKGSTENNGECFGCELITHSAVTLKNGRTVCSSCPEWRFETEARYTAELATNEDRKRYLAMVEESRGKEAASCLRKAAWEMMEKKSNGPQA